MLPEDLEDIESNGLKNYAVIYIRTLFIVLRSLSQNELVSIYLHSCTNPPALYESLIKGILAQVCCELKENNQSVFNFHRSLGIVYSGMIKGSLGLCVSCHIDNQRTHTHTHFKRGWE